MTLNNSVPSIFDVLLQIGPNHGVLTMFNMEEKTMEQAFNALGESALSKVLFPNVPQASMYFGQMMNESGSQLGVFKKMIKFKTGNMLAHGLEDLPGGIGSSIVPKGGRGR